MDLDFIQGEISNSDVHTGHQAVPLDQAGEYRTLNNDQV